MDSEKTGNPGGVATALSKLGGPDNGEPDFGGMLQVQIFK